MNQEKQNEYAQQLSRLIQFETVSFENQIDRSKFRKFHELLRKEYPSLFKVCEYEDYNGSLLLRWKGSSDSEPLLFMNHHDVVDPTSAPWTHEPFSGEIAGGKVWGRGTLDTKGGLWAMLRAGDELAAKGFVPERDIYFESACTEEVGGDGARDIAAELNKRGIHFAMSIDEGGMIMDEPIPGAKGTFAMIGVGEKGCADLKFIARSEGGHASTPGKNTPLVRLGKFMAATEKSGIFKAEVSDVTKEMLKRLSSGVDGALKKVFENADKFAPLLKAVMPAVSPTAGAMLKTTLAFTMAEGSEGYNVLPQEAYVTGNMRFSHHQGGKASIEAVRKLASKFDIETEIIDPGNESPVTDFRGKAFKNVEKAIEAVFPGVVSVPYIMTGASDSRFMSIVCDDCIRFAPFTIDEQQLKSIHAADENVDVSSLCRAVEFYKYLMTEN